MSPILQEQEISPVRDRILTPEEVGALPDIQAWLDWMRKMGQRQIVKEREIIRKEVIEGILAHSAEEGLGVEEKYFKDAQFRIRKLKFPKDFDVYGDQTEFYLPTFTFDTEALINLFLQYGAYFINSLNINIPPRLFPQNRTAVVVDFLPKEVRQVSVLFAGREDINRTAETHAPFAIDPFINQRGKEEKMDQLINKWLGILNLLKNPKNVAQAIEELISDRAVYFKMIHEESEGEQGLEPLTAELLKDTYHPIELARLQEVYEKNQAERQKEAEAFEETHFGRVLGFRHRDASPLVMTDSVITPIFNFLNTLVQRLGYGKALSLLMRSKSMEALLDAVESLEPKIDFAKTAYADLDLVRKVLNSNSSFFQ